jgi:type I restriction enzyme, S subunit
MTGSASDQPVPKGWRLVRLNDVCEIQLGKMLSPAAKTGTESRPYLRNVNVQWGRIDVGDLAQMDFDDDEQMKFALRPGDLLACEGDEPGRAAVWHGEVSPCFYQKALHRLRPIRDEVDPAFVMYRLWLGATSGEFGDAHAKTTIAHLPAVRLAQLAIAVPPTSSRPRVRRSRRPWRPSVP